jgi:hypothetical protein
MFRKIAPLLLILSLVSCTNDSTSDLIDNSVLDSVSYNENVKPIINNNCISCHGTIPANGAPMSLATYQNVKDAVLNRGLIDRISRGEGEPGHMPLGGPRLPQNLINIIIQWQSEDFPE